MSLLDAITRSAGITAVVLLAAWTLLSLAGSAGSLRDRTGVVGLVWLGGYAGLATAEGVLLGGLTAICVLLAAAGCIAHLAMRVLPGLEEDPGVVASAAAAAPPGRPARTPPESLWARRVRA